MKSVTRNLRSVLQSRNDALYQRTMSLVQKAGALLAHAPATFPSGTSHTADHTSTVEKIASWILSDEALSHFSDSELSYLILACHFHDLGMVGTEEQNATAEGRDGVRMDHAVAIGTKIRQNWMKLGFQAEKDATILAEICRGHRPPKSPEGRANWAGIPDRRIAGPGDVVRTRLLAAVVYAADELHLGDDRAPEREQEWLAIVSPEASIHWSRHQQVSGPALDDGVLRFEVTVQTVSDYDDIRNVLKKALQAYSDLRNQIEEVFGNVVSIPHIVIDWLCGDLFKLLAAHVVMDMRPRLLAEIIGDSAARFDGITKSHVDLAGLCHESPGDGGAVRVAIGETLQLWLTEQVIVRDQDDLVHLDAKKAFSALFKLTTTADRIESSRGHIERADHTRRLYQSAAGHEYIHGKLYPLIADRFSVAVKAEGEDSPIRVVLKFSPTACRLIETVEIPPSVLSKRDLLLFACATGVCFDLYSTAPLILEPELRHAVRKLFEEVADRLPRFQRLVEEIAIVSGLTQRQAFDALRASTDGDERGELSQDSGTVNVHYEVPLGRPEWQMLNVLYAGQRAGEKITFVNMPFARFTISANGAMESLLDGKAKEPHSISVGPGKHVPCDTFLRGCVEVDGEKVVVRTKYVGEGEGPLILRLPANSGDSAKCQVNFDYCNVSVGDAYNFRAVNRTTNSKDVLVELDLAGHGRIGQVQSTAARPFTIPTLVDDEPLDKLFQIDPSMPIPIAASEAVHKAIELGTLEDVEKIVTALRAAQFKKKPVLTSLTLRCATSGGRMYHEEVFEPLAGFMSAPIISDGPISSEEFGALWNRHSRDLKMVGSYSSPVNELAANVRSWVNDPQQEFPLRFGFGKATIPQFRTVVELIARRPVDRVWYVEFPVVIRLRSTTKREQLETEHDFFETVGDEKRRLLLAERLADSTGELERSDDERIEQASDSARWTEWSSNSPQGNVAESCSRDAPSIHSAKSEDPEQTV